MSLTVDAKKHWKSRIRKRIDQHVERLIAGQDPILLQRVCEQAREQAYESLGLRSQRDELEIIEGQLQSLGERKRFLEAKQRSTVNGRSEAEELERDNCPYHGLEIRSAIKVRADTLEPGILGESGLGKQVLALREEKDTLMDAVVLATSSSQIREIWAQLNLFLGAMPVVLERKIMRFETVQTV